MVVADNQKYVIESGHTMCHPETCCCWNYRIKQLVGIKAGETPYVYNTDNRDDASAQLAHLISQDQSAK